ncbi:MAG: recombinase family protein [Planctomycetaceae bacterium]
MVDSPVAIWIVRALKQLLADIEAGKVNCVVVYKVDRLSRSLMDFARMLEVFERNQVAFVSVTQQFNTTNSMGRLMLNVLLSFAQFERELISERTRDKIAAARAKANGLVACRCLATTSSRKVASFESMRSRLTESGRSTICTWNASRSWRRLPNSIAVAGTTSHGKQKGNAPGRLAVHQSDAVPAPDQCDLHRQAWLQRRSERRRA